jgi:hypothetical protein
MQKVYVTLYKYADNLEPGVFKEIPREKIGDHYKIYELKIPK